MAKLTQLEIDAFLAEPRIAHLATLRAAGTPHVAPVWFLWEEGKAMVIAEQSAIKVRNIRRNPAVALSVANAARPLAYVVLEGQAEIIEAGIEPMVKRICVRYDGPEKGTVFAQTLLDESQTVVININVDRIMTLRDDE